MAAQTPDETNSRAAYPAGVAAVVLAAGKSSRMKSRLPKTMHPLCGRPILAHILSALESAGVTRRIVVVGHEAQQVMDTMNAHFGAGAIEYVHQTEQRGTGHAVQRAQSLLSGADAPQTVLVAAGDTPLITAEVFSALLQTHQTAHASATLLSAVLPDGASYGRIVRGDSEQVLGIVEAKDASPAQKQIREINAGVYAFQTADLFPALEAVRPANAQNEIYLTDVIGVLREKGHTVGAFISPSADVTLGVNTRIELADAAAKMRRTILNDLMLSGVTVVDPETTYVDAGVRVGQDTILLPSTHLLGETVVGEDCVLGPNAHVLDSHLGHNVRAKACFIESAAISDGCKIGPFAHIRPGSSLAKNVRIGNFVETKAAHLHEGVAAGHLSYLGDAEIGAYTNIGAGTITCNYDGEKKHRTVIGERVFVGSQTAFVAPVAIGDGAATAAGSTITRPVPPGDLGVARERQTNIAGWAAKRNERKAASKEPSAPPPPPERTPAP